MRCTLLPQTSAAGPWGRFGCNNEIQREPGSLLCKGSNGVQRAASGCSGQQPGPRPPLLGHRLPAVSVAIRGGVEEHLVTWGDEVSPGRGGKHGKSASSGGGATIIMVGVYTSEQIRWQGKWEEDLTFHRYAIHSAVLGAHHCPRKLHDDR